MAKIYETLKKKNDLSVEVYPNIESQNIPSSAISTDKIEDSAVTQPKLAIGSVSTSIIIDGAVTKSKLGNNSVSATKIESSAVTTIKINDGAVTTNKLGNASVTLAKTGNDVYDILQRIEHTYNVFLIDDDNSPTTSVYLGSTTFSSQMDSYSISDWDSAFDFTKGSISDWSSTDITILKLFIDGFSGNGYQQSGTSSVFNNIYFNGNESFRISHFGNYYTLLYVKNNVEIFKMIIDSTTDTITSYIQKDINLRLNKLTNNNISAYTR